MKDAVGTVGTVVVLGGTSEIALAAVRALAPTQSVVLAGRNLETLTTAGAALDGGAKLLVKAWDAAVAVSTTTALLAEISADIGDIDVVIAAAGLLGDQERSESDLAYAAEVMTVNYVGVGVACLAAAQHLKTQGHGTLVVLSSVAAVRARRANFVYGSTKAGLDALASGLADALVGSGANVVVVRPGFVHTRMTAGMKPAPLATTADVVGAAVAAGVRSGKPLVWAPAPVQPLFTILRSVPRPVWRKLPG